MENIQPLQSAIIAEVIKHIEAKKKEVLIEKLKQYFDSQNMEMPDLVKDSKSKSPKLVCLVDDYEPGEHYVWNYGTSNQKMIVSFYPVDVNSSEDIFDFHSQIKISFSYKSYESK